MPTSGTASYRGTYNALVRTKDTGGAGEISAWIGGANTTADFDGNTVVIDIQGLAYLQGDISGDRFSGTDARVTSEDATSKSITASPDGSLYTGTFSGAFFGPDAVEIGGVFDFTSEGKTAGEFRGAFGGLKN